MVRAALSVGAAAVLFVLGAAATQGKRPCPGNSCHGQTTTVATTVPATTTTVPTTTASPSGWTVPASIPADCSIDVAAQLRAWLATVPDGQTARFNGGCYRVESVLELDGRALTVDGGGATFRSLNPPDDQRPFWRAVGSNLTFQSMALDGSYTAGGTLTDSLQHAHGFDLRGTHATISRVTVTDVAGDCVYYGLGYDNTTRSSGSVDGMTCDGTGRNGVSVTAGHDITVSSSSFSRIGYDGVDVEPNSTAGNWGAATITVSGNTFAAVHLNALSVVETGPVSDVTLVSNTASGAMRSAVGAVGSSWSRPQNLTVRDNTGGTGSQSSFEHVDGLAVSGNTGPVSITDCTAVTS